MMPAFQDTPHDDLGRVRNDRDGGDDSRKRRRYQFKRWEDSANSTSVTVKCDIECSRDEARVSPFATETIAMLFAAIAAS